MLRKRESAAEEECSRLVSETREKSGGGREGGRAGIALKGSVTGGGGKGRGESSWRSPSLVPANNASVSSSIMNAGTRERAHTFAPLQS